MMALAVTAQSTFDPRIYDTVVRNSYGDIRNLYLASVNPKRTLDNLFKSKTRDGRDGHPEYLYIEGNRGWGMSVVNAFAILSYMITESPHALLAERERAIKFVAKFARYYAEPIKRSQRPPKYLFGHDYFMRYDALDLVEFLGTVSEVPLVEEIIRDSETDLRKLQWNFGGFGRSLSRYEQIQDKGLRIIEILRQRSPSQR